MPSRFHIHIADDHPLIRNGLCELMRSHYGNKVTLSESDTLKSVKKALADNKDIDLLILDLYIPGSSRFTGLIEIKKNFRSLPVIIVTANDAVITVSLARHYGASGFVSKKLDSREILNCINEVQRGKLWFPIHEPVKEDNKYKMNLTRQQQIILEHISLGHLNKKIAYEMNISEATVKAHISIIFKNLKIKNRTQAALLFYKNYMS